MNQNIPNNSPENKDEKHLGTTYIPISPKDAATREPYTKVFKDPANVTLAKKLSRLGFTLKQISKHFGVDHSSVIELFKRINHKHARSYATPGVEIDPKIHKIKGRRSYIKIFRDERLVAKAIELSGLGYNYKELARHFKVDKDSIKSLFKRIGHKHVSKLGRPSTDGSMSERVVHSIPPRLDSDGSKINQGHTYAEYLKMQKERDKTSRNEDRELSKRLK